MDKRENLPMASEVIYREDGKMKLYCVPTPLPFDELIKRFELDRAAEQAKGANNG